MSFKKVFIVLCLLSVLVTLSACKKKRPETHQHSYEWVIVKESTLSDVGAVKGTCSSCNDEIEKELPKLTDSTFWNIAETTVTCEEAGRTKYVSIYGDITIDEQARGHKLSDLIKAKDPSCSEYGCVEHYECVNCGKYYNSSKVECDASEVLIDKLSHQMTYVPLLKATQTTAGHYAYYHCSVCDKNYSDSLGKVAIKTSTEIPAGYGSTQGMKTMYNNYKYPTTPTTPSEKNSWEYISSENETITWYVDVSSWVQPTGQDAVSKKIKEVTGINVKFETPVSDDGTKLATMIAGGVMPDVISVPTSSTLTIYQLASQGYVYDINTLAEKWAPSLYYNLPKDVWDWWSFGDGFTYGIPNHYYSYNDINEEQLQPNGGMMIREDLFKAWQTYCFANKASSDGLVHYTSLSGKEKTVEWQGYITTPEGFKEAAKWALQNYKGTKDGDITTGLLLSQFKNDGCTSLNWLSQFFAIPFEDANGNYTYQFTMDSYKEMLMYLNDLYNEGIISKANFTYDYNGIGGVVASGQAFATLVTPQDYQMHFVTASEGKKPYVSMYITNENGDAPVLADIRGYGYLMNMITTSCKRPDLVIKLFDYLTSKEGQLLVTLGIEGETWNWADEEKTEIEYTGKYLAEKKAGTATKYGLMQFDTLINYQMYDNYQPKTNNGKTDAELLRSNLKRPLTIYSYDYNAMHFVVDTTDPKYNEYAQSLSRIESLIGKQVPKIIQASSRSEAEKIYNTTVSTMEKYGLNIVIELNTKAYAATKAKLGIDIAWPPYMPGYDKKPDRLHPNGDTSYYRGY